jgi:hypothetical protein
MDIYELRLRLASPAIITPTKADTTVPGLPTLDGFLSFVAFRAALGGALDTHPGLARELLWQWNAALRNPAMWVEFGLPLRQVPLDTVRIYDCSIGLPVVDGNVLIPVGAFFADGQNLVTYPKIMDSLALRRRVGAPDPRPLKLAHALKSGSGTNKALDNRLYYALTEEFAFYFRGDKAGVERLLEFAREQRIGIGKKTTLGYGQIASYVISSCKGITATFAVPVPNSGNLALIKTIQHDVGWRVRTGSASVEELFGCKEFRIMNAVETLGAYRPPYWQRGKQTQVLLYGTMLIPRA